MHKLDRVWDNDVAEIPPHVIEWMEKKRRREREGNLIPLPARVDIPYDPLPKPEEPPSDRGVVIIQMYQDSISDGYL